MSELSGRPLRGGRRMQTLVHVAVIVFFALGTLLLFYETLALARPTQLEPITAYVRCARQDSPFPTFVAALVACFLLGRWLAPPRTR